MATRNSTANRPFSRNRQLSSSRLNLGCKAKSLEKSEGIPSTAIPLQEIIEGERGRLLRAQAVLGCLQLALEYAVEGESENAPYYPDVVATVSGLVSESITRLDSVHLRPLVEVVRGKKSRA